MGIFLANNTDPLLRKRGGLKMSQQTDRLPLSGTGRGGPGIA
jgi:hypothetical protein